MTTRAATTQLRLTPADAGRALGLDEFLSADADEGYRYELIRGRLVVSPPPNMPHENLLDWLRDLLKGYANERPDVVNKIMGPARIIMNFPGDVSAPEADLVAYHDFPTDMPSAELNWADNSPVLAVEIVSEDNADKDLERNPTLYLGVPTLRECWVIDPRDESHDRPSLTVYRRRGRRWQKPIEIAAGGTYASHLFPGLALALDRRAE